MSSRPTLSRPPHPALHVRDDRDTPLFGRGGMARGNHRFRKNRSEIFFAGGLDSRINVELFRKIGFSAQAFRDARRARDAGNIGGTPIDLPVVGQISYGWPHRNWAAPASLARSMPIGPITTSWACEHTT
jgi:hypothetical protein